jgi:hypothetical protein
VVRARAPSSRENVVFVSHAREIQALVDQGDDALRAEVKRSEPEARGTVARILAEVA